MKYKLAIGFIAYGEYTLKYLPIFLSSLFAGIDQESVLVLAVDCSENTNDRNLKILKKYPQIKIIFQGSNLGFGRAHNMMISRAKESGSKYYLALNPDMLIENKMIGKMLASMEKDGELGSVSPRIMRWDFNKKEKTDIIDTLGIEMKSGLLFFDIAQGKKNPVSTFSNNEEIKKMSINILGPSGAAAMYSLNALEKVKDNNGYFDNLMFMYKEDADLAYRLFLAGFKSRCVTDAIFYHDRTASEQGRGNLQIAINRKNKNKQCKKWSFLHQNIIFIKYWRLQNFRNKLAIIRHEFKMIVYAVLFERYLLAEFINLWKARKKIIKY
ncbi:hypothetical protein A2331_04470 [Candidatus Falkowbacteria bacterium RIFOXYB2_FULL_34_18]|uniref:Glycosyltransferase 2-like domain-containing protein n=1 Tax=Candidatus Falkowbacteria bacterium RIFOXYD2_FULL_34_120 TaxID=1798007 RepID=A0A1F5TM43_9BACT|nr:MAG: hypothetical protein A2331_04470 [Candidatus Falkowbacteria bacterium RIFOXYB2_FULL_34_18]OGF30289.1 MAG: hypothetical protein A2500_06850 [Candidatus Falkowbacteria bacterium RIFOXYC12_FULL_34_55]OGF37840.1 MAG: hypothetical protein A2466_03975 [Candidatus Falkowbacteria bacterium RIFOXYC2_FULL_34_220]OGF39601.1 MAG: hypothetical protein A2515_03690 [Candidatus Falkowbacteria bacterium RIFOXYD12_FULL_34_57]OGF40025.1 MAG: hypothetical protein A2531_07420 [Candidatus Falkowbacteria bact